MSDVCYACHAPVTPSRPFMKPVCNCKGSLQLHAYCYKRIRAHDDYCRICNTPYPTTDTLYERGLPVRIFTDECGLIHNFTYDENDDPHGTYIIYYPSGGIASKRTFRHGKPALVGRSWDCEGRLRERYTYLNGELNSYYYRWREDGTQESVETFVDGERYGRQYTFLDSTHIEVKIIENGCEVSSYCAYLDEVPPAVSLDVGRAERYDLLL